MKNTQNNIIQSRKIRNTILTTSLLLSGYLVNAQEMINQNSQITQSVLDAASFSANNTGSVDISIPITDFQIENYKLDVKLKHNSTGVKINRDADLFGVNWDLNVTGIITREINKYPDELDRYVRISSNLNNCIKLEQSTGMGYFYNRDRIKTIIPPFEANYPNVPLSVSYNPNANGVASAYFKPPRLFDVPEDPSMSEDYEPDIFTVVIPGYKPFKFFFDLDKNIVVTNDDNYKIMYTEDSGEISSFQVIDKNGTWFYFSKKEKRRMNNLKTEFQGPNILPDSDISNMIYNPTEIVNLCPGFIPENVENYKKPFVKSWYLDLISNVKGESIHFTYRDLELYNVTSPYGARPYSSDYAVQPNSEVDYTLETGYIFNILHTNYYHKWQRNAVVTTTPVLQSISTASKGIFLQDGNLREDIFNNGFTKYKKIDKIDVWSFVEPEVFIGLSYYLTYQPNSMPLNYKKIRTFELDYFYSTTENTTINNSNAYAHKRLFLNSITQKINNVNIIKYNLSYNGNLNQLPNKQTTQRDLWNHFKSGPEGSYFHNIYYYPDDGRDNVDLGPFSIYKRPNFIGAEKLLKNFYNNYTLRDSYFMDKTPDFNNSLIGSLKSITTSLGAVTNFTYEQNFFDYYGIKRPAGGLRIKSVENIESGKKNRTDYYYGTDGNGIGHVYMNTGINRRYYHAQNEIKLWSSGYTPFGENKVKMNFLEDAGSIVYYDIIKKITTDENGVMNGYKTFKYSLFKDTPSNTGFQLGNVFYKKNLFSSHRLIMNNYDQDNVTYDTNYRDYYPFNDNEDFSDINGNLLEEKIYDSNNNPVKFTTYNYNLNTSEYKFIKDINSGYEPATSLFKLRKYNYLPVNETTTDYFTTGSAITSTDYLYNSRNLVSKITTNFPDSEIMSKELKYHYEQENAFVNANRFSELSEEKTIKNGKYSTISYLYNIFDVPKLMFFGDIMGGLTVYNGALNRYLLYGSKTSIENGQPKEGLKINIFGKYGVAIETETNTIPETTIYGYQQTLPIAKIKGATYNQVMAAFNLDPDNYDDRLALDIIKKSDLDVDDAGEINLLIALDNFRNLDQFKQYEITTYTYDISGAVTSMTLPTGIREYYKYDTASRLIKIVDNENKIIKEIDYGNAPIQ